MPGRRVFVGDRVQVHGRPERVLVVAVTFVPERYASRIDLEWDGAGRSHVWSDEEGDVWVRWSELN